MPLVPPGQPAMLKKFRITANLFLIIGITLTGTISLLGYASSRYQARRFIQMKVESGSLTSEVILHGLLNYMSDRDLARMENMISLIGRQPGIERVRLINCEGKITLSSRRSEEGETIGKNSGVCMKCHADASPLASLPMEKSGVVESAAGKRKILTVVTPIHNAPSCASAECHHHSDGRKVLGMIQTDYSLATLDREIATLRLETFAAAGGAVAMLFILIWRFINFFITAPVRKLLRGMKKVSAGDLSYRYPVTEENEIGHIGAVFNVMVDELEAKTGELRNTRDYLSGIIESSGDIITTADRDGIIASVNAAGEKILGYARDELAGLRVESLFVNPSDRDEAITRLNRGSEIVNYETLFNRKEGQPIEVITTMSYLKEPDGRIRGTICVSKDVSEFKELQRKLVQSERLAAAGTAVASLSHNAKNILNNLKGGSYLMRLGFSKEKMELLKEGWSVIEMGISKLSGMAMDMLNFAGEKKLEFSEVSINDLVGEVCDLLSLSSEKSGVELTWDLTPDLPPIKLDAKAIHTAILNVAANAMDSCGDKEYPSGERAKVHIATYRDMELDGVRVEVRDNGVGMEEGSDEKIFKPFYTTKFDSGTGLGLSITLKAVKAHGGSIDVKSRPGEGATFTVRLPYRKKTEGGVV